VFVLVRISRPRFHGTRSRYTRLGSEAFLNSLNLSLSTLCLPVMERRAVTLPSGGRAILGKTVVLDTGKISLALRADIFSFEKIIDRTLLPRMNSCSCAVFVLVRISRSRIHDHGLTASGSFQRLPISLTGSWQPEDISIGLVLVESNRKHFIYGRTFGGTLNCYASRDQAAS